MSIEEGQQNGSGENQTEKNQFKLEEEMSPEELKAEQDRENLILNFKAEDLEDEEKRKQIEEALKNSKTTIAQKRHFREKYNELKKGAASAPAAAAKPAEASANTDSSVLLELRQDNPWMSKDTAKEIVDMAKARGESVETTMQRPYVAAWLEQIKADLEIENASLAPSKKGGGGSGATERDWSTASPEEVEKQRLKILNRG